MIKKVFLSLFKHFLFIFGVLLFLFSFMLLLWGFTTWSIAPFIWVNNEFGLTGARFLIGICLFCSLIHESVAYLIGDRTYE